MKLPNPDQWHVLIVTAGGYREIIGPFDSESQARDYKPRISAFKVGAIFKGEYCPPVLCYIYKPNLFLSNGIR